MSRKGESIYKRKDGRWEARYVKKISDTGKKILGSVYAKTYTEVKEKRNLIVQQLKAEKSDSSQRSITLSELMWLWLEYRSSQIAASSYQKYESMIRNHIQPYIGKIKVVQLSKLTLQQFSNSLLKNGSVKGKGGLSVGSVNSVLTILSSALSWMSEWSNVPLVKIPFLREPHSSPQILSKTEQILLEQFVETHKNIYSTGILFSLYTGMRLGEICALQWEDISDETIFVHRSMQRIKTESGRWEVVVTEPKTINSFRIIPIPDRLKNFLNKNSPTSGYIFTQKNGKFIEPRLMQNHTCEIFRSSCVSIKKFHSLRHTFATRLIDCGSDPKTVSELLGHASVQITLNKYVHPSLDMKKTAIDKVSL